MDASKYDMLIAGFGSPRGDDLAGWQVVDELQKRLTTPARAVKIAESAQLLDEIKGCQRMILVETCHGGERLGSVTHFAWPDPRIRQYHNHSAHGVRLCNALQLADRLGKLPPVVDVYGIDTGAVHRIDDVSPEIKRAVVELVDVVLAETNEAADAREVVC